MNVCQSGGYPIMDKLDLLGQKLGLCFSCSKAKDILVFVQFGFKMKLTNLSPIQYWFIFKRSKEFKHSVTGMMPYKLKM
jgi:hypothetical protein